MPHGLLIKQKMYSKGAFHLSELANWTIARPVSLITKKAFFQELLQKTISFVHTIQDLTDLAEEVWLLREIIIATGMVWPVSSDKWKAP